MHDVREVLEALADAVVSPQAAPPAEESISQEPREVLMIARVDGVAYALVKVQTADKASAPCPELSPREREIVRLVADGRPNKAIAESLDISPWTVATHIRRIFTKLDVRSRAQMVACVLDGVDREVSDGRQSLRTS